MMAMLRIEGFVVLTKVPSPQSRSQKEGGHPAAGLPPELSWKNTLLTRERRVSQCLEHRTDRVGERAARAAGEAETDRAVPRLGHHERAGIAGVDEVPRHHDLTGEGRGARLVADVDRDVDRLDRAVG